MKIVFLLFCFSLNALALAETETVSIFWNTADFLNNNKTEVLIEIRNSGDSYFRTKKILDSQTKKTIKGSGTPWAIKRGEHYYFNMLYSDDNNYIIAKNNQFKKPVWTDKMIGSVPENIKQKLDASNDLLNSVITSDSKLVHYKSETKKQILRLSESLNTEAIFINKYLSTWKPMRIVQLRSLDKSWG